MNNDNKRNTFTGSLGFVLAAAGSAVGLGNIWRFPFLAAKDGGGLFLVIYLVLALTFGYTLLTSEIAIGRKTKQSPLTAYGKIHKGCKTLGILACMVPIIIMPYYCVIGGWVLKYFVGFATGNGKKMAKDGYFSSFITKQYEPIIYMVVFLAITAVVVFLGVNKGIESFSKIIMPALIIMIIGIAIFSLTIKDPNSSRTGVDGLKKLVIPNFDGMTAKQFFKVTVDAMGQLFFSLSVAMGIMVAYGSYMPDDAKMAKSINQIEIFDTLVAFLAAAMIIPSVFTFMGEEGMSAGPGLIFITLPKVFEAMGGIGAIVGALFFAMVIFAAITSSVSIMEAVVSSFMDQFKVKRRTAGVIEAIIAIAAAVVVCLGYNKLFFNIKLPNGSDAQILDIMDYISNNIFMPIVAISECILIGYIIKPETIIEEVEKNNTKMGRKVLYKIMIKYVAPVLLIILFLQSLGLLDFILN